MANKSVKIQFANQCALGNGTRRRGDVIGTCAVDDDGGLDLKKISADKSGGFTKQELENIGRNPQLVEPVPKPASKEVTEAEKKAAEEKAAAEKKAAEEKAAAEKKAAEEKAAAEKKAQ